MRGKPAVDPGVLLKFADLATNMLQSWDKLSDEMKENFHSNMKYATSIIGEFASQATQMHVNIISNSPFMQVQGSTGYCGLCAVNNAMQGKKLLTIKDLDQIADRLWLQHFDNEYGCTLTDEVQAMRSIDGYYSIDVLGEGARLWIYFGLPRWTHFQGSTMHDMVKSKYCNHHC